MPFANRRIVPMLCAALLFLAGIAVGSVLTRHVSAINKFGQPRTVVHVVAYKFRDATSLNDQEQAIAGIKDNGRENSGIKNIWLKTERNQLRDFSGVYVLEFISPKPLPITRKSLIHDAWRKKWEQLRENSLSFQVSN